MRTEESKIGISSNNNNNKKESLKIENVKENLYKWKVTKAWK